MRWGTAAGFLVAIAVPSASCVDPKSDYDDWLNRTADSRAAAQNPDAGLPVDAAPPTDAGFDQQLVMACLPFLAGGNVRDAILFAVSAKFTASPSGGGTLDFSDTPLLIGATDTSMTTGTGASAMGVAIAPDGTGVVNLGPGTIPANANPLGSEVQLTDSALHVIISGTSMCAGESGHISSPVTADLQPPQNPCIFFPATPPFPALALSQFHCP